MVESWTTNLVEVAEPVGGKGKHPNSVTVWIAGGYSLNSFVPAESSRRKPSVLPTLQALGQILELFQFDDLTEIPWLPCSLFKSDAFRRVPA